MTSSTEPRPAAGNRRAYLIFSGSLCAMAALVGLLTFLVVQRWYGPEGSATIAPTAADGAETASPSSVTLFYVAEDGMGLIGLEREVPYGADTLARARAITEHQLSEAPAPLMSPFPEGTRLRSVYLAADGNAFVDLSREVTTSHSGGSLDELFTVYALVNALTMNVPEIRAVQIMIEGREVDTLAGHIDLRQPLEPNMQWVVDPDSPDDAEPPLAAGSPPSGLSTLNQYRSAGGASRLASLLRGHTFPICSLVTPRQAGATLYRPPLIQRGQTTRHSLPVHAS